MNNTRKLELLAVKAIMQEPCYELNSRYQAAVSALVATGMDKDMAIAEVLTIISELDKEQKAGWKKRGVSYV